MSDSGSRISNIASYGEIPRADIGNVVLSVFYYSIQKKVFILYTKVFSKGESGHIVLLSSCCLVVLLMFGRIKGFQEFITEIGG